MVVKIWLNLFEVEYCCCLLVCFDKLCKCWKFDWFDIDGWVQWLLYQYYVEEVLVWIYIEEVLWFVVFGD